MPFRHEAPGSEGLIRITQINTNRLELILGLGLRGQFVQRRKLVLDKAPTTLGKFLEIGRGSLG